MDELTMDDLQLVEDTPAAPPALIRVAQLPIIIQHLEAKSAEVQEQTKQAMELACSPETLADVKKVRAALNRDLEELEAQRKAVKNAVMAPYEEFEAIYRRCIKVPFENASKDIGAKIFEVEQGLIGECRAEMQRYFSERATDQGVDWLTWDRLNLKITLTDAKQKSHKKLIDAINLFVDGVAGAVKSIADMAFSEEIMVEYRQCLVLHQAVCTVNERHRRIEEEQKRKQEWEARQKAEQEAAARVQAAAAAAAPAPDPTPIPQAVPAPAPAPVAAPAAPAPAEKIYKLSFSVRGTKAQLVDFKKNFVAFCEERGLNYE